jgi:hypothetical protein
MQKKKKQPREYRKNKKAFDSVLSYFRKFMVSTIGASKPMGGGGKTSPNPTKPSVIDYRADVMKAVSAKLPKDVPLSKFLAAYVLYDSEDSIERELHAQKVIGDRRHSVEQRLGEEFIRRGIFPVQGKGYFYTLRRKVPA